MVAATGPGQVWMADITDIKGPFVRVAYKAYSIQDLYSRNIIAFCVATAADEDIAAGLFADAFDTSGGPRIIHSDNGATMRSDKLAALCSAMGVTLSFNRPNVSKDNPFKESEFRTMRHRPSFPGHFTGIEDARDWITDYVDWFNTDHHHSGRALFTPQSLHDGSWEHTHATRARALTSYYEQHPERFDRQPETARPSTRVGINLHHELEHQLKVA